MQHKVNPEKIVIPKEMVILEEIVIPEEVVITEEVVADSAPVLTMVITPTIQGPRGFSRKVGCSTQRGGCGTST